MQNKWIFGYEDIREIIKKKIQLAGGLHGYKAILSRSAGCQPAYFSQVLAGRSLLTSEQAAGICEFWMFDELETEYFLTLVELSRAGTSLLEKKLRLRLANLKEKSLARERRLEPAPARAEKAVNYYLDWTVSAVHIILSIPGFNESKVIARKLEIEEARVLKALAVLQDLEMAERKGGHWALTTRHLHASQQTLFASLHHRNWRDKVKDKLPLENSEKNLHYTSLVSLSKGDFLKLREMALKMISDAQELVRDSQEETLACVMMDLFEV